MGFFQPGLGGVEGGVMVVALASPSSEAPAPAGFFGHNGAPLGNAIETCRGGCDFPPPVKVAYLHSAQGHGQAQGHSGHVRLEPLHQVSPFQDVESEGCETPPAGGVLHGLSGPEGWVLALAH